MTPAETIARVREVFADVPRPEVFTRGTCVCDECAEHDATLKAHTPDSIGMAELGNPGWDPVCMANDRAFAYYLPALVRLAFAEDYYDQFLFHLDTPGRLDGLSQPQLAALLDTAWVLADYKEEEIFGSFNEFTLTRVIAKLERLSGAP